MKNLLTAIALFISLSVSGAVFISLSSFTPAPDSPDCNDQQNLYSEVTGLVNDQQALNEMDLTSMAQVTFTINDENKIHIDQVVTKDNLFEFYIRQKLEGAHLEHCFEKGRQYTLIINAKAA
jgi:hypothetical protein